MMTSEHRLDTLLIKSYKDGKINHYFITTYCRRVSHYCSMCCSFSGNVVDVDNHTPEWSKVIGSKHNTKTRLHTPARRPYLPACSAPGSRGGVHLGGVPGPRGGTWSRRVPGPWGVYLVPGGAPCPGGVPGPRRCTWSRGVYLVWGCTWSEGLYLVPGGVPGPGLVYLVLGGVPGP